MALTKLRRALLPTKFDPTGNYRRQESVHLRAVSFRLLVHAEIESYLEDKAIELASRGWTVWKSARITTDVTVALIAFAGVEACKAPGKLGGDPKKQKAYDDYAVLLEKANGIWRYDLKNNHGVKEENVLALFLPLGISPTELDTTLLADLSSYGALRGEVAHASSLSVTTLADPKSEFQKAELLIRDLTKLDASITTAITRINKVTAVLP